MLHTETAEFQIEPRGSFSLDAAARFLAGFSPFSGSQSARDGHVHLGFVVDGTEETAGVCLRDDGGVVIGEVVGDADVEAVRRQVARILSLDVDGSEYEEVGRRDEVVGELQARYAGLRPVCFYSPFEAGAWALISHRVQMTQAAKVKARLAEELGQVVEIHGDRVHAFPAPARLLELSTFRGLFGRKVEYLHGLAESALEGQLEAERLRAMPEDAALADLRRIGGVGDFSARLILLRGAGTPDGTPTREPRFLQALTMAYGLEEPPDDAELTRVTDAWRPYRTWVVFTLRVMLGDAARNR